MMQNEPARLKRNAFRCSLWTIIAVALAAIMMHSGSLRLSATQSEYIITAWESDQGLPESSATAMVQTSDGYLWFGTFNGLVRFDGISFETFDPSNTPELKSPGIVNLHLDTAGRLWISTLQNIVCKDGSQWKSYGTNEGWAGGFVRSFAQRTNGDFAISTFTGKIREFSNGRFHELPDPPMDIGQGCQVLVDEQGQWWAAQHRFVGSWDGKQWRERVPSTGHDRNHFGAGKARGGGFWILAGDELIKIENGVRKKQLRLRSNQISDAFWSLYEDSQGYVWITSYEQGLYRIDSAGVDRHWTTADGLSYNSLRFVFEDHEKNYWVGSSGGGLMRFKPRRVQTIGVEDGLTERLVKSACPGTNNDIYVGTWGQGVFRIKDNQCQVLPLPYKEVQDKPYVHAVFCDRLGRLWVGTFKQGAYLVEPNGNKRYLDTLEPLGNAVRAFFEDSQGRIWIGGAEGVAVWDNNEMRLYREADGLPKSEAHCFAQDASGQMIVGLDAGLYRLSNGKFQSILSADREPIRNVVALKAEPDGSLWIGSVAHGLLYWHGNKIVRIGRNHGLVATTISGILEDDRGNFWLASNRGLMQVAKKDLLAIASEKSAKAYVLWLDTSDGLSNLECPDGNQPTCAKDAQGRLWFSTAKGLAWVNPAAIHINHIPPPVHLQRWSYTDKGGKTYDGSGETASRLVLPPGTSRLELRFGALSFSASEKNTYAYRLSRGGLDISSATMKDRTIEFYWLGAGDYQLHVRAANNDGEWNEKGALLAFTVTPFFWQTFWFRFLLASGLPLLIGAGGFWYLRAHAKREEEQRAWKNRYDLLAKAAGQVAYEWDTCSDKIQWSESLMNVFGYDSQRLNGSMTLWRQLIHEEDVAEVARAVDQSLSNKTPYSLNYRLRHHDGRIRWVSDKAYPATTDKLACKLVGWIQDMTDRKQAEDRILQQATLLEATHDAIFVFDINGGARYMNRAAEELTGLGFDQAQTLKYTDVIRTGSGLDIQAAEKEVAAQGVWSGELTLISTDNKKREINSRWSLLRNAQGKPKSYLIICTDISEKKKLEAQYLRSQRLESVGTLASGVAHDLNNILSPIVMGLDVLKDEIRDPEMDLVLEMMQGSAQRGKDTVKQLLAFARGGDSAKGPVQPRHLVKEIVNLIQQTFPKNIQVYSDFKGDSTTVMGDPSQLHQVLMNLCVNARDAMPNGGVIFLSEENVTLDKSSELLHPKARPGSYVLIKVSDNGSGIAPEIMDRIFDPFFTTKPIGKGTGLGLATVIGIVEGHGGFVHVESALNVGSAFSVYLPAIVATLSADDPGRPEFRHSGHNELVLLVDDEPAVVRLLQMILLNHGYKTVTAGNAVEAFEIYKKHRQSVRLILSDIMMPIGDGHQLIAAIRNESSTIPIVAMSGVTTDDAQKNLSESGADAFVPKPFNTDQVLAAVHHCLKRAESRGARKNPASKDGV